MVWLRSRLMFWRVKRTGDKVSKAFVTSAAEAKRFTEDMNALAGMAGRDAD